MPNYRRNFIPGGTFFFTVVTHQRRPILTLDASRDSLHRVIRDIRKKRPFELLAIVLLPDHLHAVWTLPAGDAKYSLRSAQIKEGFTRLHINSGGEEGRATASRSAHRERAVWQQRFWEHTCRDEEDLKRCVDYVHWNPVKHGLARSVGEYPWSSFHRFVREGEYDPDWGREIEFPGRMGDGWE